MRKFIFLFLSFISTSLFCQNFSVNVKSGISFPMLRQMQGSSTDNKLIYVSYAKGWASEVEFEKRIVKNIWLTVDAGYLLGSKQVTDKLLGITEYYSEQFRSIISVKFVEGFKKFSFFTQVGTVIPLKTQFYRTLKRDTKNYYTLIKGYTSAGMAATLGFNYYLSSNFYLAYEMQLLGQRIRVKELDLDGNTIIYQRNQTYELPFSSLNTQLVLRYVW